MSRLYEWAMRTHPDVVVAVVALVSSASLIVTIVHDALDPQARSTLLFLLPASGLLTYWWITLFKLARRLRQNER